MASGVGQTAPALAPSFNGYIASTHDALLLFEACNRNMVHQVSRRPHDRERSHLIRSGNIFIFDEVNAGIKRWTDGVAWSPSRILGNFLVYRQLERPFASGERKKTREKRTKKGRRVEMAGQELLPQDMGLAARHAPGEGARRMPIGSMRAQSSSEPDSPLPVLDRDRALLGSLVDSYGFKDGGLIKKTMSVLVGGNPHHIVSYYRPEDVMHGSFTTPSNSPLFKNITISSELLHKQNFRIAPETSSGAPLTEQSAPEPVLPNMNEVNTFGGRPSDMQRHEPPHAQEPFEHSAYGGYRYPPNQQGYASPYPFVQSPQYPTGPYYDEPPQQQSQQQPHPQPQPQRQPQPQPQRRVSHSHSPQHSPPRPSPQSRGSDGTSQPSYHPQPKQEAAYQVHSRSDTQVGPSPATYSHAYPGWQGFQVPPASAAHNALPPLGSLDFNSRGLGAGLPPPPPPPQPPAPPPQHVSSPGGYHDYRGGYVQAGGHGSAGSGGMYGVHPASAHSGHPLHSNMDGRGMEHDYNQGYAYGSTPRELEGPWEARKGASARWQQQLHQGHDEDGKMAGYSAWS